jgi:HEPN domain-containing protein
MNKSENKSMRWIRQAQFDLDAADSINRVGFPEIACYLAHLSAENALRAYLFSQSEHAIQGHATHRLVQRCAKYDEDFIGYLDGCRQLDQYFIATRYPSGLPDGIPHDVYTQTQAHKAVEFAKHIITFIYGRLESEGSIQAKYASRHSN